MTVDLAIERGMWLVLLGPNITEPAQVNADKPATVLAIVALQNTLLLSIRHNMLSNVMAMMGVGMLHVIKIGNVRDHCCP